MKWKKILMYGLTIGLSLIAVSLWAADFSRYSTEELLRLHDGIHRMNPGERQSFMEEMHSRYPSMTRDEREQYRGYMHDDTQGEWSDHRRGGYHHDQGRHTDGGFRNNMDYGRGGTGRSSGHHR